MWRIYTTVETLFTTSWVQLINQTEFTKKALDNNLDTFFVYVVVLVTKLIHLS